MARMDTRLESEGAEFLVLGHLLINRIAAYKTYTNMAGYDLIATNAEENTSARIQVKSRWGTGFTGFPINNFDCDFVVAAFLNRGSKDGKRKLMSPDFFVFPTQMILDLPRTAGWGKIELKNIGDLEGYREKWSLIREFLNPSAADSHHSTTTSPRITR